MAIWTKYLNPEDLLLTKVQQGIEQLNLDILISASMPSFSERFHSSFSPLILSSSSLLLVTAPSNSKTFPPSYYALPFNLLLFPFYCWKQVYKEFFFHLPRIFEQWDLPHLWGCGQTATTQAAHPGSCLMPLLSLHNFSPGHKPLLPVQTTFSQDKQQRDQQTDSNIC